MGFFKNIQEENMHFLSVARNSFDFSLSLLFYLRNHCILLNKHLLITRFGWNKNKTSFQKICVYVHRTNVCSGNNDSIEMPSKWHIECKCASHNLISIMRYIIHALRAYSFVFLFLEKSMYHKSHDILFEVALIWMSCICFLLLLLFFFWVFMFTLWQMPLCAQYALWFGFVFVERRCYKCAARTVR